MLFKVLFIISYIIFLKIKNGFFGERMTRLLELSVIWDIFRFLQRSGSACQKDDSACIETSGNLKEQGLENKMAGVAHLIWECLALISQFLRPADDHWMAIKSPCHVFWHIPVVLLSIFGSAAQIFVYNDP